MITTSSSYSNALPGPDNITRVELPNGIVVLTRSNFNSPSVVVNGYLANGSMNDTNEKAGLATFTSLCLTRGTEEYSFHDIFEHLESAGANLGYGASVHTTSFGGRALSEDLPLLLRILSSSLRRPVFPVDQIERLRAQLLTGLAIRAQDTGEMASITFDSLLFKGHPYGRPEDGFPETVKAITRSDLENYWRRFYGPRGMVIVVVGSVAAQEAIDRVQQALGDWQNAEDPGPSPFPVIPMFTQSIRQHLTIPGKSQTDLLIGCQSLPRRSPDYVAASLGNSVLGQFGMMGRIGEVVREQAGLAYSASSNLNAWNESGSWEVSAGVNPANLQKAIDLILQELKRFISSPVEKEELQDSQANFIGRLPLSLESNAGVANAIANIEKYHLGLDYYRHYVQLVERVTPEMVLEVAQKYISLDRLAIVSAGS